MQAVGAITFTSLLGLAAAGRHAVRGRDEFSDASINEPIDPKVDVPELKVETIEAIPDVNCPFRSGDGSVLVVNYIGELLNGKLIDHSMKPEDIQQFQIGTGMVLKGWEDGLKDMCIGETRKLIIPSRLAHGKRGGGGGLIPPNHALVYTIVLRELKRSGPTYPNPAYFASISQPGFSSAETSSSSEAADAEETAEASQVEEPEMTPAPSPPRDEL
ncbi:hypothetical protein Dda_3124 [Drechslerella dactyloides]|uniref:peptidylprolyl isomerase n=1 Tax=Drechslerella dactyloides TaxID=74499 RepID=A0AAD6J598_DREDA|nr:hypothetical protein Dda_3124 [Drechslerella dactyloides]